MINNIRTTAVVVFASALCLASCNKNSAKVSGRFSGMDSLMVYLEQVTSLGQTVVDSVRTDAKGNFKINIKLPDQASTFYNLKVGSRKIPLFVSPGEKINITSQYGKPNKYEIAGSQESVLLKELNDIMNNGTSKLDSLACLLSVCTQDSPKRQAYLREYVKEYGKLKRDQIKFIVSNSKSLAALYALYQRLPNDWTLFNGDNDIIYYRLVADSVAVNYPDSPYLAALRAEIAAVDSGAEIQKMVGEKSVKPVSYPDIELLDMYGKPRRLSESKGKIILLDFHTSAGDASAVRNAELRTLYDKFAPGGFEIYQVYMDKSKPEWVTNVQKQKLPWITVCDMKGFNGIAPKLYNVSSVPANYLIDSDGEIVAKNITVDKLRQEINKLR